MSNFLSNSPKKLLFLVTEDWVFCSHRLPTARAARKAGLQVVVATHVNKNGERIKREGFRLIPIRMRRSGHGLFGELLSLIELIHIYRAERPDIVHHVAIKPVVFGSLAALFLRPSLVVNAVNGFGTLFLSDSIKIKMMRFFVQHIFRFIFNQPGFCVIVQNPDDFSGLSEIASLEPERISLILGSGVDISHFTVLPEPLGVPVIALVSRMLTDKGVCEFVEAAKILRKKNINLRLVLVGPTDPDNATSIDESQLRQWSDSGVVEWWGERRDVREVWAEASIAVLPSYREGLPKTLLEAAACGRPIITTNVPGCREVVRHEENGLLVPAKDSGALAQAIFRLIDDPKWGRRLGLAGRKRTEALYSEEIVVQKTLALYKRAMGG